MTTPNKLQVACIQATPYIFNLGKSLGKAKKLIEEAGKLGNKLVLFPESFLPGYPAGLDFGAVVGSRSNTGREHFREYWQNSVEVPGPVTNQLAEWAARFHIYLVMGVTERDRINKTLYCTLLYFGPDGCLLGKHRKIKPTASERIIWGEGDGSTLVSYDTDIGKIGGLICWENYMPLARTALYNKGIDIYLAPTADSRTTWQHTMCHIACEGRCFVLGCNQYFTKKDFPAQLRPFLAADRPDTLSRGGSVIVSPLGKVIAGPLYDKEGIVQAEIDLNDVVRGRMDFDVTGHYSRNDIFTFRVHGQPDIKKV